MKKQNRGEAVLSMVLYTAMIISVFAFLWQAILSF